MLSKCANKLAMYVLLCHGLIFIYFKICKKAKLKFRIEPNSQGTTNIVRDKKKKTNVITLNLIYHCYKLNKAQTYFLNMFQAFEERASKCKRCWYAR